MLSAGRGLPCTSVPHVPGVGSVQRGDHLHQPRVPHSPLFARDFPSFSPDHPTSREPLSSRQTGVVGHPREPTAHPERTESSGWRERGRGPEGCPLHVKTGRRGVREPGGHMWPGWGHNVCVWCLLPAHELKVKAVAAAAWPAMELRFLGHWAKAYVF